MENIKYIVLYLFDKLSRSSYYLVLFLNVDGGYVMLQEIIGIRQISGEGQRRWFTNSFFELIVWYKKESDDFLGFQLCYDKSDYERSLTWKEKTGYRHQAIDDERNGTLHPQSPILVKDGSFDSVGISQKFKSESSAIDTNIVEFVFNKISNCS